MMRGAAVRLYHTISRLVIHDLKAAGHQLLQDAPADAYIMFTNFIDDSLNAMTIYTDFNEGQQ